MPLVFRNGKQLGQQLVNPALSGIPLGSQPPPSGAAVGVGFGVAAAAAYAYAVHKARLRSSVGSAQWRSAVHADGTVADYEGLLSHIADKGLDHEIRADVWPLLLGVYGPDQTSDERALAWEELRQAYVELLRQCQDLEAAFLDATTVRRHLAARAAAAPVVAAQPCAAAPDSAPAYPPADDAAPSCPTPSTDSDSPGPSAASLADLNSPAKPPRLGHISRADVPPVLHTYWEAQRIIAMDAVRTDFKKNALPGSVSSALRDSFKDLRDSWSGGLGGGAGGGLPAEASAGSVAKAEEVVREAGPASPPPGPVAGSAGAGSSGRVGEALAGWLQSARERMEGSSLYQAAKGRRERQVAPEAAQPAQEQRDGEGAQQPHVEGGVAGGDGDAVVEVSTAVRTRDREGKDIDAPPSPPPAQPSAHACNQDAEPQPDGPSASTPLGCARPAALDRCDDGAACDHSTPTTTSSTASAPPPQETQPSPASLPPEPSSSPTPALELRRRSRSVPLPAGGTTRGPAPAAGLGALWLSAVARFHLDHAAHFGPVERRHVERMVTLLSAYAAHDPALGYCQGMSDLALPFVLLFSDDALAFWCFAALMKKVRANFLHHDGSGGVFGRLAALGALLTALDGPVGQSLAAAGAAHCHFAYRMMVVALRRELPLEGAMRLWEQLWADDALEAAAAARHTAEARAGREAEAVELVVVAGRNGEARLATGLVAAQGQELEEEGAAGAEGVGGEEAEGAAEPRVQEREGLEGEEARGRCDLMGGQEAEGCRGERLCESEPCSACDEQPSPSRAWGLGPALRAEHCQQPGDFGDARPMPRCPSSPTCIDAAAPPSASEGTSSRQDSPAALQPTADTTASSPTPPGSPRTLRPPAAPDSAAPAPADTAAADAAAASRAFGRELFPYLVAAVVLTQRKRLVEACSESDDVLQLFQALPRIDVPDCMRRAREYREQVAPRAGAAAAGPGSQPGSRVGSGGGAAPAGAASLEGVGVLARLMAGAPVAKL